VKIGTSKKEIGGHNVGKDGHSEDKEWLAELDREERNNNRKHKSHRDDIDVTIAERDPEDWETYPRAKLLKLSRHEDWLEIIFSQRSQDLHHLTEDEKVSAAIKNLTEKQKQVLHLNIVWQYTTQDIAEMLGTTDRNVRKHREKALEAIRRAVAGSGGEGYAETAAAILGWMIIPTFMIGWAIAKRTYPFLKRKLTRKAA
jgi:RNA polymerase sigma factor (sigma-70 family)